MKFVTIRWREGCPVSRNGRKAPRAEDRGLDIGGIFMRTCSLGRRRFGTVNKSVCLQFVHAYARILQGHTGTCFWLKNSQRSKSRFEIGRDCVGFRVLARIVAWRFS